jgi:hypothetical protein
MNRWLQFFLVQFGIDTSYLNRHVVFEHRYSVPVRGVSPTSGGSRYVYPIARTNNSKDACESMHDSQWIPLALAMCQARQRFCTSIENTPCAPLHMIIHGEGGYGKSWLIRHIVKDIHCVFGERTVPASSACWRQRHVRATNQISPFRPLFSLRI